jgi:hypothetical protein
MVKSTHPIEFVASRKQRAGGKSAQVAPAQHRAKEAPSDGAAFLPVLGLRFDRGAAPAPVGSGNSTRVVVDLGIDTIACRCLRLGTEQWLKVVSAIFSLCTASGWLRGLWHSLGGQGPPQRSARSTHELYRSARRRRGADGLRQYRMCQQGDPRWRTHTHPFRIGVGRSWIMLS